MQEFEKWLLSNKERLDSTAYGLFMDSLRCFKVDIDRPAYLLAYQGMMCQLKCTIINSKKPEAFPEGEWNDYLNGLRHDHSWDENTYDRAVQKEKVNKEHPEKERPAVLCMTEEVRNKFPFFREMRNICAHYKEYHFIKAHTQVLYSFIAQYLLSITVEGGMKTLLKEFKKHYDPSLTSPNESFHPLVEKIPSMVRLGELNDFIDNLQGYVGQWNHSEINNILHYALVVLPQDYKDAIYEYLRNDVNLENKYISIYPESVSVLLVEKEKIRQFWYGRIFNIPNPLEVLAQLIQSGMLVGSDVKEAFERLLSYYYANKRGLYDIKGSTKQTILSHGFADVFLDVFFHHSRTRSDYQNICYNTDFFMSIIDILPVDDHFVNNACDVFDSGHPMPYTLRDRFKNKLEEETEFRTAFKKVLEAIGRKMPNTIDPAERGDEV